MSEMNRLQEAWAWEESNKDWGCVDEEEMLEWFKLHESQYPGDFYMQMYLFKKTGNVVLDIEFVLYRMFDDESNLLYVGISLDVIKRVKAHQKKYWWNEVVNIRLERFNSKEELMAAEILAIKNEGPKYNIQHNETNCQIQSQIP